jgi:hypothetical protein
LVLVAAAIHATWNAVLKASSERFLTFAVVAAMGTDLGNLELFCLGLNLGGFPFPVECDSR